MAKKLAWNRCPRWLAYMEGFRFGVATIPHSQAKRLGETAAWSRGWRDGKAVLRRASDEAAGYYDCIAPGTVRTASEGGE